jgi:hypothetical protein
VTQPIDRAFVEIEPDTRDFSRELNSDIEKAYNKVERQTIQLSKKITTSFDAAGRKIERTFTSMARDGKVTTTVLEKSFDAAGDKIQRTFKFASSEAVASEELIATVAKVAAESTAHSWQHAGERIESAFREAQRVAKIESLRMRHDANQAADSTGGRFSLLRGVFKSVTGAIGSMTSAMGDLAGNLSSTAGGFIMLVAKIAAVIVLTGPIIGLGGALADLVGLIGPLPAALGVLLAAIIPLVFAFQGLGDAIKAVNSGDPKKIAEAMKGLAPAARSVVKEITGLNGAFDRFRKNIQQSLFAPIVGDISRTARTLMPSLQKSIDRVATAIGRAASNFFEFLREPGTVKILNNLFNTTAFVIDRIAVGMNKFIPAFFKLIDAGLPFMMRFASAFGTLLGKFAVFIEDSIKSRAFNDFVEEALDTTKKLFGLIGALGDLLGVVFGGNADDLGRGFIQKLTDMVNELTAFFKTAKGQQVLDDLKQNIVTVVVIIGALIKAFKFVASATDSFMHAIKFAADSVGEFFAAIGKLAAFIGGAIADGFGKMIDFFKRLPGQILDFLSSLPGKIGNFFKSLFDTALREIGMGIGLVIFVVTQLPGRIIAAVKALPELLGDLLKAAWTFAENVTIEGITRVVSFVKSLPGRIVAFASSVGDAVSNFFTKIFDGGKTKAKNAFDSIVNFFKNLPSRLGSFVTDVGGKIANVIKNMINHAINKINEGISSVDRFLPGDALPHIPNLAQGAIVKARPGGTIARLAEAGQDEIVGPLKDVAKLFENNGGTTITFGPGSVAVTFEGAVPTTQEAFQTGQAVGQGIVATLTRRNIRTSVRTL